jgi:hypothetical protein
MGAERILITEAVIRSSKYIYESKLMAVPFVKNLT